MADTFKGIITADGKKRQLPYGAVLEKPVSDKTLSEEGGFADSKTVGDKFAKVDSETASIKENLVENNSDIDNLSSSKISKFYASSQGENHLADSDDGKIMDMMLYGKSEQKQYSGKNLINSDEYYSEYKQSDGTYKGKANVFTAISVPISKYIGTQITVSCKVIVPPNVSAVFIKATINGTTTEGNRIGSSKSGVIAITITPKTESDIIIITYGTGGSGIIVVSEFQIEKASEATSYEPYVGGHPSPSPDYPQEIKSVVNPTVKVCGKNLSREEIYRISINNSRPYLSSIKVISPVSVAAWAGIGFAVKVTPNTQYTISTDASNNDYLLVGEYKSVNDVTNYNNCIKHIERSVSDNITFTSSPECNAIVCCIMPREACDISWTYWQIELGSTTTTYEPYHEQTVTLPYTLNAIPVNSGGNITINGQQYVADYVDVERGKLVKMVDSSKLDNTQSIVNKTEWLLAEPQEIDLTTEEITAFKALTTYYPTTNISVNSEQLDGYTVFNYPISMQNGWNYVKQQIGDTREYIYDMDARTQDTDLQAAEAYVNSEYAVALTELEV